MASIKAGGSALISSKWLTLSPNPTITVTLTVSSCGNSRKHIVLIMSRRNTWDQLSRSWLRGWLIGKCGFFRGKHRCLEGDCCRNARGCRCRRYRNGEIHLRTYRERHPDQIKPRIRRMAPYSPGGASCAWYREARPGDVLQALVRERRESIRVGGKPG